MAKIQVKRQKLELACLEEKKALAMQQAKIDADVRLQLEKREIRMKLVAFVSDGSRIDADAGNDNVAATRRARDVSRVFE